MGHVLLGAAALARHERGACAMRHYPLLLHAQCSCWPERQRRGGGGRPPEKRSWGRIWYGSQAQKPFRQRQRLTSATKESRQFLKPPSMSIGRSLTLAPSAQVARGSQRLPNNRDL